METINYEISEGVGKNPWNVFFAKNNTASKVMDCYRKNLKDANVFSCFGWTVSEMIKLFKLGIEQLPRNKSGEVSFLIKTTINTNGYMDIEFLCVNTGISKSAVYNAV